MPKYLSVMLHGALVVAAAALASQLLFLDLEVAAEPLPVSVGYMVLMVLSLPWSLAWFVLLVLDIGPEATYAVLFVVIVVGGASVNVGLHYRWRRRQLMAAALQVRA